MKNNQFKKLIRTIIEENNTSIYVDINNNERMYYLYNNKYKCKGTISTYLTNKDIRIRFKRNDIVTLCNKDKELCVTYLEIDKVISFLRNITKSK